jgi:hypothetical protein
MAQAYYSAPIRVFSDASDETILGALTANSGFAIETPQCDAWQEEIALLKAAVSGFEGTIHLEFIVPRIGSRIDAVVIADDIIIVLEFKVGETEYQSSDLNQAWDYALDLKNFHSGSHDSPIIPILVATEAAQSDTSLPCPHPDGVFPPARANARSIRTLIQAAQRVIEPRPALNGMAWALAPYQATPTIIEAAQALFAGHSVETIGRTEASIYNLRKTSQLVELAIDNARRDRRKAIVFVTGVPGAGKTLVGLNIATKRRDASAPTHAVFLSGNGPLVAVLRAALTRDALARRAARKERLRRGDIAQEVKAFIQNVHHFRDEGLNNPGAPSDHVVIFDEAQRAWSREMTSDFMRRKKNRPDFDESEPEFLLSCLDRHPDWAVVVCLVGGGQEINRGEAGIGAWLEAARDRFPEWRVYMSSALTDTEYAAGKAIASLSGRPDVTTAKHLHLAVSVRSFRAENVSRFVKAVLDCDRGLAKSVLASMLAKYPVVLTRSLPAAKRWVRAQARGSERYGLVASSGAQRLKPHAVDIRVDVDPVQWFLSGPEDTRSSYYLEDAATEFQVQGLELDWACVVWDADLRFGEDSWLYHSFRGTKWQGVHASARQQYLRNAYRVLLTRARQGMAICVPEGDESDPTRNCAFYDATYDYLAGVGVPILR